MYAGEKKPYQQFDIISVLGVVFTWRQPVPLISPATIYFAVICLL
jgi:hypothetical protein